MMIMMIMIMIIIMIMMMIMMMMIMIIIMIMIMIMMIMIMMKKKKKKKKTKNVKTKKQKKKKTRGARDSTFASIASACSHYWSVGLSLGRAMDFRYVALSLLDLVVGSFSQYSGFLPSFIG